MDIPTPVVGLVDENQVTGKTREIFDGMKQVSGSVPKWMKVMANCDDTFVGFFALFKSVMDDAPTDRLLKWKIAFVISELNKCDYCVSVSKMQLENLGLKEEDLVDIEKVCGNEECLAIEYAKAVNNHAYKIDPKLMVKLKGSFNDQQIVELTSVVGLFNFINRFNDALRILPDA